MATSVVLRHALRLYLSPGSTLRYRSAVARMDPGEGLSHLHGPALLPGNCGRIFSGTGDEWIARRGMAGGGGPRAGLAPLRPDSRAAPQFSAPDAVATLGPGAIRRRAAHLRRRSAAHCAGVCLAGVTAPASCVSGRGGAVLRAGGADQFLWRDCAGDLLPDPGLERVGYLARQPCVVARRRHTCADLWALGLLADSVLLADHHREPAMGIGSGQSLVHGPAAGGCRPLPAGFAARGIRRTATRLHGFRFRLPAVPGTERVGPLLLRLPRHRRTGASGPGTRSGSDSGGHGGATRTVEPAFKVSVARTGGAGPGVSYGAVWRLGGALLC